MKSSSLTTTTLTLTLSNNNKDQVTETSAGLCPVAICRTGDNVWRLGNVAGLTNQVASWLEAMTISAHQTACLHCWWTRACDHCKTKTNKQKRNNWSFCFENFLKILTVTYAKVILSKSGRKTKELAQHALLNLFWKKLIHNWNKFKMTK